MSTCPYSWGLYVPTKPTKGWGGEERLRKDLTAMTLTYGLEFFSRASSEIFTNFFMPWLGPALVALRCVDVGSRFYG